jgi:hypothetical protein
MEMLAPTTSQIRAFKRTPFGLRLKKFIHLTKWVVRKIGKENNVPLRGLAPYQVGFKCEK